MNLHSQTRHFHPTKPARLVNEALDLSAGLIHGIHSVTGLPWAASIPLTALLVRSVVGLPLQIYTRVQARRERDIAPLVTSWRVVYTKKEQRAARDKLEYDMRGVSSKTHAMTRHLRKKWKIHTGYRFANLLQLPVWLALMESLRGLCGNRNGLVPWLLSLIEGDQATTESLHLTVEPSLAHEGALWFPDLLAGDPTGILPAALTASIILNVRSGWNLTPRHELADLPKLQMLQGVTFRALRLLIQVMAINVGVAGFLYDMPAALMIYWITSTNAATLQNFLLAKYMFMRPPVPSYKEKFVLYKNPKVSDPYRIKLRSDLRTKTPSS